MDTGPNGAMTETATGILYKSFFLYLQTRIVYPPPSTCSKDTSLLLPSPSTQHSPNMPTAPLPDSPVLSFPFAKLHLGPPHTDWATLSYFHSSCTLHLTTCRLHFDLPYAPPNNTLSIPLVSLVPKSLTLRRPFFDSPHLAAMLLPIDPSHTPSSLPIPSSTPLECRIELTPLTSLQTLKNTIIDLLADTDRITRDTRKLRNVVDKSLVKTHVHYAFVDPVNPSRLHLATQMAYPHS